MMKTLDQLPPERQTKITFDPGPHKYYDDNGLVYTSVTTLIGNYKKPFNKKYWSMYTALKTAGFSVRPDMRNERVIYINGVPRSLDSLYDDPINSYETKLVVQEWSDITDKSIDRGNRIHNRLEDTINTSKGDETGKTNSQIRPLSSLTGELIIFRTIHDLDSTGIQLRYPEIYQRLKYYIDKGCTLYAEKRVFSTTFQIAGTIDVLIVKGNKFAILDWKTNKDVMRFESGYYRKVKSPGGEYIKTNDYVTTDDRLLHPIDYLQECKGVLYTLQINMYATMMIRWGYKLVPHGLHICHIMPSTVPKFIEIEYDPKPVHDMLLDHYNKRVEDNLEINDTNFNNNFGIY